MSFFVSCVYYDMLEKLKTYSNGQDFTPYHHLSCNNYFLRLH
jgi:hypothetical protein